MNKKKFENNTVLGTLDMITNKKKTKVTLILLNIQMPAVGNDTKIQAATTTTSTNKKSDKNVQIW
jgi:hypothetical protein